MLASCHREGSRSHQHRGNRKSAPPTDLHRHPAVFGRGPSCLHPPGRRAHVHPPTPPPPSAPCRRATVAVPPPRCRPAYPADPDSGDAMLLRQTPLLHPLRRRTRPDGTRRAGAAAPGEAQLPVPGLPRLASDELDARAVPRVAGGARTAQHPGARADPARRAAANRARADTGRGRPATGRSRHRACRIAGSVDPGTGARLRSAHHAPLALSHPEPSPNRALSRRDTPCPPPDPDTTWRLP